MPAITEHEKARIRRACGYPGLGDAYLLMWGIPVHGELIFALNKRMEGDFAPEFLSLLREDLERAERTVDQAYEAQERLAVSKIGNIETNPDEIDKLGKSWATWVGRIADALGIPRNSTARGNLAGSAGINARVA